MLPIERYGVTPMLLKYALQNWSRWKKLHPVTQRKVLAVVEAHDFGKNICDLREEVSQMKEAGVPGQAIVSAEVRATAIFIEKIHKIIKVDFKDLKEHKLHTQKLFWLIISLLRYSEGSETSLCSEDVTEEAEHFLSKSEQTLQALDRR